MIPEDIKEYREGFLGGGSCALAFSVMNPNIPVWVNDLYYNLYIFWTQVQSNTDSLVNRILDLRSSAWVDLSKLEENHRKLYRDMQDLIKSDDHHDIATAFYILNRTSFGGFTEQNKNSFTHDCYRGGIFTESKVKNLIEVGRIMQPWRITNQDYRTLMTEPGEDVFVFLDPPYLIKDMLYGKDRKMHSEFSHEDFIQACKDTPHNWMITYNEHEWLREQFSEFHMENFEFTYSLAHRPDSNKNKKEELLIMNYELPRDKVNPLQSMLYG